MGRNPFTDGALRVPKSLDDAWLRKNGNETLYKAVGSPSRRYKGGVSCYYEYEFNLPNRRYGALHRFGNTEICCDCKGESKGGN